MSFKQTEQLEIIRKAREGDSKVEREVVMGHCKCIDGFVDGWMYGWIDGE